MKTFIAIMMLMGAGALAQTQSPLPELAQIKMAAEAGDAEAQVKMAERYQSSADFKQAVDWYRKAALQDYLPAETALGHLLVVQHEYASFDLKPAARAAIQAEALRWIAAAANANSRSAQAEFAEIFFRGGYVKQDLIEAYKWGDLAAQGSPFETPAISGRATRDAAILKMTTEQIDEARKRVANFKPTPAKPLNLANIQLISITGKAGERMAIINNRTFAAGDQNDALVDGKKVTIRCLEVKEASVVISIDGVEGTRELKLKPDLAVNIRVGSFLGKPGTRMAIINNRTLIAGDQNYALVDGKRVTIRCLEVKEASVVISIDGVERELKLKPDQIYQTPGTSTN